MNIYSMKKKINTQEWYISNQTDSWYR